LREQARVDDPIRPEMAEAGTLSHHPTGVPPPAA